MSLAKKAMFGVGVNVASKGRHHLSVGFPYGVGYNYEIGDPHKPGLKPTVGVGLTGPMLGAMYRHQPHFDAESFKKQQAPSKRKPAAKKKPEEKKASLAKEAASPEVIAVGRSLQKKFNTPRTKIYLQKRGM